MHHRPPLKVVALIVIATILLTACTVIAPEPSATDALVSPSTVVDTQNPQPADDNADTSSGKADTSSGKSITDTARAEPTATLVAAPTLARVEEPTSTREPATTLAPPPTLEPTATRELPPTLEPTATLAPTSTPIPQSATATILISRLNMRAGPGTNYGILSVAQQGRTFNIIGQAANCEWLQVEDAVIGAAWIAGTAQYVSFTAPCASIPVAASPPASVPPTSAPASTPTPAAQPTQPPAPGPTAPPPADNPLPADEGCYLFQNQLGPEITITLTAQDWQWSDTFRLAGSEERPYCLGPGRYTYTIDAPPPWNEINGELKVTAGERLLFPIRASE